MDLLYTVHRKQLQNNIFTTFETKHYPTTICSISTCNIIAFTTTLEITDTTSNSWGFHVYVTDINTPWLCYKVTSNKYPISVLEWDNLGKYLLIGDTSGNVQIWIQKDYLLSEWVQLYTVYFPGEHIIRAVFFHNGRKIVLLADKKDQVYYMDKFQRINFQPSVRQYGGVPAEGCFVLTSTGMLGAFQIPSEPPVTHQNQQPQQAGPSQMGTNNTQNNYYNQGPYTLPSVTESLGLTRNFYTTADISYSKNGHFLVAVSSPNLSGKDRAIMVRCYRVVIKKIDDKLIITSTAWPSFFINEGAGSDLKDLNIKNIKWSQQDDAESLIIASNHSGGCFIELWQLIEKSQPIHKLFQTNKNEVFKTIVWMNQCHYFYSSKIIDITITKLIIYNNSYITIGMADNTIHYLNRDTLTKRLQNTLINYNWRQDDHSANKQIRLGTKIQAINLTWIGNLLLAIDNQGQLYIYKINNLYQDQQMNQLTIINIVTLLEYCLITGLDCLDIFLSIKIHDTIIDKLTENFNRQSQIIQQYYYANFLTLKTNLYRLSITGQVKAYDLTSLLMLHSILIAFKSLLRPSDLMSHDNGPAENLAMVLSDSVPDVDKVLLNLEGKDFTVEPSTLQSLQQLIQWVADLALNILAKLPENRVNKMLQNQNSGYEISKDIVALNSIRELLVMIRFWGLLKPQCLPVFSQSADNLDILATLFRLLTRLSLNPNEPDELLLDECCLLPSQVLIPQLQFVSSRTAVASPVLAHLNLPLHLDYNIEPDVLKFCPDLPSVEGGLSGDNMVDSVRHLQLGKRPPSLRRCSRCGACSSVYSVARTPAMRAWEQRWLNGCKCGGFWRLENMI